jgi:hypothetical protein
LPGGGGGGGANGSGNAQDAGPGGGGAVRIIWGPGRYYPNISTADATVVLSL